MGRAWVLMMALALPVGALAEPSATARDAGPQVSASVWECQSGHSITMRIMSLENALTRYALRWTGCQDPSHEGKHPCSEGNFGMPEPSACNWYWCGFMRIEVNGSDAALYTIEDQRLTDSGARAGLQVIWAHPDAEVGLRLVLRPESNHLEGLLTWTPRAGHEVKTVALKTTCYPSFFTTSRQRVGDRHCATPRVDCREGEPMAIVPGEDTWLYYYDTVFDMARGEGEGPCALMVAPGALQGGAVDIGGYAVSTTVDLKPEAGAARLALWDFAGKTNAEARGYLDANGTADLAALEATDFRPLAVQAGRQGELAAEAAGLLAAAAQEGEALRPRVDELLGRLEALRGAVAAGDWRAEAETAALVLGSDDLMWRLRICALLNGE